MTKQEMEQLSEWIGGLERASGHFWKARKGMLGRDGARFAEHHTRGVMEVAEVLGSMRRAALFGGVSEPDDKYITEAPDKALEGEEND